MYFLKLFIVYLLFSDSSYLNSQLQFLFSSFFFVFRLTDSPHKTVAAFFALQRPLEETGSSVSDNSGSSTFLAWRLPVVDTTVHDSFMIMQLRSKSSYPKYVLHHRHIHFSSPSHNQHVLLRFCIFFGRSPKIPMDSFLYIIVFKASQCERTPDTM